MDADYEYFRSIDKAQYTGEWVVILDKQIVAHGTKESAREKLLEIRAKSPGKTPFIAKVSDKLQIS